MPSMDHLKEINKTYNKATQDNLNSIYGSASGLPNVGNAVIEAILGITALRLADICDELVRLRNAICDIKEGLDKEVCTGVGTGTDGEQLEMDLIGGLETDDGTWNKSRED